MDTQNFYKEIESELIGSLNIAEIDKKRRTNSDSDQRKLHDAIDAEISKVVTKRLESLSSKELEEIINSGKMYRRNYMDLMMATAHDNGLVCTLSMINVAVIDYISENAKPKQNDVQEKKHGIFRKPKQKEVKKATEPSNESEPEKQ